jgi:hypothetical protein
MSTFQPGSVDDFLAACQIGDALHWWGTSALSKAIEAATKGGPSHVAMVRHVGDRTLQGITLVESTQVAVPHKFIGVVERPFADEWSDYKSTGAQGVWCPLRTMIRTGVDWEAWAKLADTHVGEQYSYAQMVLEAYDAFMVSHHVPGLDLIANDFAGGNWHMEFCSQLWCLYGQGGKYLGPSRVPGLTAPVNSLQAAIYGRGVQILGPPLASDCGYNLVAP